MVVKYEVDPENFEFWGGAKARMDDAAEEQRHLPRGGRGVEIPKILGAPSPQEW